MVELADAPRDVVVVRPFHVQFFDSVESVLAELDVVSSRITTFIFVSRNVNAMSFQVAETISRHDDIRTLAFNELDASVIHSGTLRPPVPPQVHVIKPASRMSADALDAHQALLKAGLKAMNRNCNNKSCGILPFPKKLKDVPYLQ